MAILFTVITIVTILSDHQFARVMTVQLSPQVFNYDLIGLSFVSKGN